MAAHSHNLGNNLFASPLNAKHLGQLLEVVCGCLADGEDGVSQPAHAQVAQFLVEEFDTKLTSKQRNVLDDGKTHSPLLILSQLYNGGEQGL